MACRALRDRYKTCPSCGGTFECTGTGCWCGEVKLDEAAREALRARFADCVCPACLQRAAEAQPAPSPAP